MRLKSVFISQYKNLRNFDLTFDGTSFIDVFVGKNGSGKSNLFEALIEIFRHLDDSRSSMADCSFSYKISYQIDGKSTAIVWQDRTLSINGDIRKTSESVQLPDNILIYYSGHNDTVHSLVKEYEEKFGRNIKDVSIGQSRLFIGVGTAYKALLLAVLLLQAEENAARRFICEKLGIRSVGETIRITLKRPRFADSRLMEITGVKKRKEAQIDGFDPRTHYWGASGIVRVFLEQLITCIKGEFGHDDIFDRSKDQYVLNLSTDLILRQLTSPSASDMFRAFDNLRTVGMLDEIAMPLIIGNDTAGDLHSFSDGQFQSAYIYAITELFKDVECLMLLDEPDAFLHPEWQFEFLKQVIEISEVTHECNHLLLSSHSASTITTASADQIRLIEFNGEKVVVTRASKAEIIRSLSAGLICFSEAEARLSINHILRNTSGAVLFCEGITDELILDTAWLKLYPAVRCPFDIQSAFDRIFLRNLFSREELKTNFPNRKMFALFDFDEAYDATPKPTHSKF
jgi:predicted ATPase